MYTAVEIAKYIINKKFLESCPINNDRLQTLLYLIQGQSYRLYNKPVFKENFYAWKQGPVIPDVYWTYAGYLITPIRRQYDIALDAKTTELINDILRRTDHLNSETLKTIVCEKGSPWSWFNGTSSEKISKKHLKKYFQSL